MDENLGLFGRTSLFLKQNAESKSKVNRLQPTHKLTQENDALTKHHRDLAKKWETTCGVSHRLRCEDAANVRLVRSQEVVEDERASDVP